MMHAVKRSIPVSGDKPDASSIVSGLGLKRTGPGRWRGPCPVHGGSSFTLSDKDGTPVWTCWQGCDRRAILDELRRRGLWPERERRIFSHEERRRYAIARAEAAELATTALDWYRAELAELNDRKRGSIDCQTGRFDEAELASAAHRERQLAQLSPSDVLAEYRQQRRENPASVHRLEQIGATWRRTCEAALRRLIDQSATEAAR